MALALSDVESACRQLDEAVARICKQHDPMGCLPFMLAFATGAIIADVAARSLRWYFVALMSVAGTLAMWLALSIFRFMSWSRHHPLLAQIERLRQQSRKRGDAADDELLELGKTIVQKYLPEVESRTLLARFDDATERTAALLGLDEDDALPRGRAGA